MAVAGLAMGWELGSRVAQNHPTFFRIKSFKKSFPLLLLLLVHNGNNNVRHLSEEDVYPQQLFGFTNTERRGKDDRAASIETQVGCFKRRVKERRESSARKKGEDERTNGDFFMWG